MANQYSYRYQLEFFTVENYKREVYTEFKTLYCAVVDLETELDAWVNECISKYNCKYKDPITYGWTFTEITSDNKQSLKSGIPLYLTPSGKLISDSEFCCIMDINFGEHIITNLQAQESAEKHFPEGCILIYPNMISTSSMNYIKDLITKDASSSSTDIFTFNDKPKQYELLCNNKHYL